MAECARSLVGMASIKTFAITKMEPENMSR